MVKATLQPEKFRKILRGLDVLHDQKEDECNLAFACGY